MSAALPTREEMLREALAAMQRAGAELSAARDWLNSDWHPVGSALTDPQAEARVTTQHAIVAATREIDDATDTLHYALRGGAR